MSSIGVGSSCASCTANEALLRCTRCRTAVYCTVSCQRAHWKCHKVICTAPEAEEVLVCTHGAPSVASEPSSALAVSQLVRALTNEPNADGLAQLTMLLDTARGDKGATTPAAVAMLRAAALDAALSADLDGARSTLRARAFMEGYGASGEDFVSALCGSNGGGAGLDAAAYFGACLVALTTRDGLIAVFDNITACACAQRLHSTLRAV